jgi:hypothetical protein
MAVVTATESRAEQRDVDVPASESGMAVAGVGCRVAWFRSTASPRVTPSDQTALVRVRLGVWMDNGCSSVPTPGRGRFIFGGKDFLMESRNN